MVWYRARSPLGSSEEIHLCSVDRYRGRRSYDTGWSSNAREAAPLHCPRHGVIGRLLPRHEHSPGRVPGRFTASRLTAPWWREGQRPSPVWSRPHGRHPCSSCCPGSTRTDTGTCSSCSTSPLDWYRMRREAVPTGPRPFVCSVTITGSSRHYYERIKLSIGLEGGGSGLRGCDGVCATYSVRPRPHGRGRLTTARRWTTAPIPQSTSIPRPLPRRPPR